MKTFMPAFRAVILSLSDLLDQVDLFGGILDPWPYLAAFERKSL